MEVKNTNQAISIPAGKVDSRNISKNRDSASADRSESVAGREVKAGYSVGISAEAQEVKAAHRKAFDIAKDTSPIRAEKMAEIKAQISSGTYQIDPGKIADGMLREAIKDEVSVNL